MLAQIAVSFAFIVTLSIVSAVPGGDPFTGHCAKSCSSLRKPATAIPTSANEIKRAAENDKTEVPAAFVDKIIRKYQTYAGCMNDCMCAAYCTVLEELADWSIESCAPVCRRARPYSTGDRFFKEMENSLNAAGAF